MRAEGHSDPPLKPNQEVLQMVSESHSVVSDSLRPHGPYSPWNSPGQNTGVGSLSLLQGIFPTQGSNPGLLHCRQILHQLSCQGSPLQLVLWCQSIYSLTHSFTHSLMHSFIIPYCLALGSLLRKQREPGRASVPGAYSMLCQVLRMEGVEEINQQGQ